jgi:hypothetical protein
MEQYGTPLEVIKQKRNEVNAVYYSAKRNQDFKDLMAKHTTFEPRQAETNIQSGTTIKEAKTMQYS